MKIEAKKIIKIATGLVVAGILLVSMIGFISIVIYVTIMVCSAGFLAFFLQKTYHMIKSKRSA